jgi:hypothetical protein
MINSNKTLTDAEIEQALNSYGWDCDIDEGRLMALELLSKAAKGSYNSHTEEGFLSQLKLMTKNRKPNRKGFEFICSMVYESSCKRPRCFDAMKRYRV